MAVALVGAGMVLPVLAQPLPATGVGTSFELAFWQSIESSNDPSLYEAYLTRFPNGTFSEIAQARISNLRKLSVSPPAPNPRPAPATTPVLTVPIAPPPAVVVPIQAAPAVPVAPVTPIAPVTPATPVAPVVAVPLPQPPPPVEPIAQPGTLAPVATTGVPPVSAGAGTAAAPSDSTLTQLLAALAGSQSIGGSTHAASAAMARAPDAAQGAQANPSPIAARANLAAGFALPPAPVLAPVPAVTLPPGFCSAEARNAFHDTVYVTAVNTAKTNNDAAAAYMRQLQSLYDEYKLRHDPDTMNEIASASQNYQKVAESTFLAQATLVREFNTLMAVPITPCNQPAP